MARRPTGCALCHTSQRTVRLKATFSTDTMTCSGFFRGSIVLSSESLAINVAFSWQRNGPRVCSCVVVWTPFAIRCYLPGGRMSKCHMHSVRRHLLCFLIMASASQRIWMTRCGRSYELIGAANVGIDLIHQARSGFLFRLRPLRKVKVLCTQVHSILTAAP